MAMGLLEILVYGLIGYGTVLMVIATCVREKVPSSPNHAGLRAIFVLPGMVMLVMLAFGPPGLDREVPDQEKRQIDYPGWGWQPSGGNRWIGTYQFLYEGQYIDLPRNIGGYSSYDCHNYTVPPGEQPSDGVCGTMVYHHTTTFEKGDVRIEGHGWILAHMFLFAVLLVWFIYQFALMLTGSFIRK